LAKEKKISPQKAEEQKAYNEYVKEITPTHSLPKNMAKADTRNYKMQDVNFETQLAKALRHSRYKSMDAKVADVKMNRLKPIAYTDYASFSYRLDGNNVDPDTEGVYLAKNQVVYQGLEQSVAQEFKNLQAVLK